MNRLVPTILLISALASAFGGCEPRPGKEPIKPSVVTASAASSGVLRPDGLRNAPRGGPAARATFAA